MGDKKFRLSEKFIAKYQYKKPPFGFNGLGELVYLRTYSRTRDDGTNEQWWETVKRVVEGCYEVQRRHVDFYDLGWNSEKAQWSAQEMYDRIYNMKFLPPGRGLWAMGTPMINEKGLFAALNNCGFVSTESIAEDPAKPFCFLMDMSMLGVGVGFDTKGSGKATVKGTNKNRKTETFEIPDTREGWVESFKLLMESYFYGGAPIQFDYSKVRPAGQPIKGFGGVASGPEPLKALHDTVRACLDEEIGKPVTATLIVDIMNMIGKCVVAGNVRRTAEICFGEPGDEEYLDLKNYEVNPHRKDYGWTSNNSIFCNLGMDYSQAAQRTRKNGEPGYVWLENIRAYSRIRNGADNKDHRASGCNPCGEQSLESFETCCLVETFPFRHDSLDDFKRTIKFAYLYAKTVTLGKTHWPETNRVMLRNRRIGCSMSGIAQFIAKHGLNMFKVWCTEGYDSIQRWDKIYSEWLAIPQSIKTTSIKPSGTVSLLAGATPGMHYPLSRFVLRRVRISIHSPMVQPLKKAGYIIEPCVGQEESTVVVGVPIDMGEGVRSQNDLSIWEQFSLAAFLQKYWADNQVSCTVSFDPDKEGDEIEQCLEYFQYQLKGISLLPRHDKLFPQMPIEAITEEQYKEMSAKLKKPHFGRVAGTNEATEKYCDGEACDISTMLKPKEAEAPKAEPPRGKAAEEPKPKAK